MSNSVVPAAAAAQAKHLVRNKKLTKQTEDQKPVHNEHDEQAPSDHEPDAAKAVQTEEVEKQASSMSEVSLSGDFTFAGALAEAAEGAASLTSESSAQDGGYGDDDDDGSGGTILLVGALGLVGAGIAVLASGGGKSNEAPTADATQAVTTAEDTAKQVTVAATDPDGDPLTYSVTTAAGHGTVTGGTGGVFTYTPAADYNGTDSFVVTATDPDGATVTQTVNVTITAVNDPPKPDANNTTNLTVVEDTPTEFIVSFTDPEGNTPLTTAVTVAPVHGQIGQDGTTYIPNANFNGTDSITYTVTDSLGATATHTINITVTPVNDPPVTAASQNVTASQNDPLDVTVTATDVDGDTLGYSAADPAHGTVTGGDGGAFVYTPDTDYVGSDSFVVTVTDHMGGTATQTVNVTVAPDVNVISIDIVGPNSTTPANVAGTDGPDVFTDNTGANTDVIITDFTLEDVIQVTGATSNDYNFTTGSDPNDLYITYVDTDAGTSNLILLDDVLDGSGIVLDYATAVAAVGFNFMTFA